jgi:hypothetical protein
MRLTVWRNSRSLRRSEADAETTTEAWSTSTIAAPVAATAERSSDVRTPSTRYRPGFVVRAAAVPGAARTTARSSASARHGRRRVLSLSAIR